MKRSLFIAGLCVFFCFACNESAEKSNQLPNFIIIFADDLGYGDLGCFGHPTIHTPHLDQMAQEGMKLTQFYVAASICTPSRAGLLTGKLPVRNGMYGKRGVLFPDSARGLSTKETTIAKALKTKNYQTACIGKWHLGHLPEYLPTEHGFDEYFGIPYSNDMSPAQSNWDYAKAAFPPTPLIEGKEIIEEEPDQSLLTKRYTDKAIDFIERNQNTPFFLYLSHTFPHVPLYVEEADKGRSKRGLYGDVVGVMDESVGAILGKLKELDLAENTFVLFTSDNGPWDWVGQNGGSAGLLKGAKGSLWEGGFRVPTIAWMPETVPSNVTCRAMGSTLDLLPTFSAMAGIDTGAFPDLDGLDISNTFTEQSEVRQELFYYRNENLVAYRKGAWKFFLQDPNPWNEEYTDADIPLLFNVEEDPAEKFNVAKEHPELLEEMQALAKAHQLEVEIVPSRLEEVLEEYQEVYDRFYKK